MRLLALLHSSGYESFLVFSVVFLLLFSPTGVLLLGKMITRMGKRGNALDSAMFTWLLAGAGMILCALAQVVRINFPDRLSAMGSPAVVMSFLATTGVNCVACAVLFLSLFLVDGLRIKRKWEVRHLMLVCSVMAVLPGFVCAIVQGSLASTSRTVNLIMSITSAAFFLLAAGMSILSAARGVVKRREMEHLQTQGPGQKSRFVQSVCFDVLGIWLEPLCCSWFSVVGCRVL